MEHNSKVLNRKLWLRTPLELVLAWVLFMLHTNTPSAQIIHHRIYALNPSQDTYLHGNSRSYYQADFLEIGVRENGALSGQESRTLLKFDIEKFKSDSHWGKEDNFNHLNRTTLTSATLTMYCSSVYDSGGSGVDIYSDTIYIARILKSWEEEKVTATLRNLAGDVWSEAYLATNGHDATSSLHNLTITVDSQTCSAGESFTFNLTGTFSDWLEGRADNYGLLLWSENKQNNRITLRLASSDNGILVRHPILEVQLEDTIYRSDSCPKDELQCVDGNCIQKNRVCNFVEDCLHGTDEEQCGISCDFESPCDWSRLETSNGLPGWQVHMGETGTPGTGPSGGFADSGFDASSHYIYVNATGKANRTQSYLISPEYAESGPQCVLHFQYHMNGTHMGSLAVVLKYQGQDKEIWKIDGNQGDRWSGDVVLLGRLPEPFQLQFVAVRGYGDEGDTALDSIRLENCSPELPSPVCGPHQFQCVNQACVSNDKVCDLRDDCLFGNDEDTEICSVIPTGGACSFENGWCEWYDIVGEDHFNWTRHQGATPTSETGPSVDHTLGTDQGYYMYVETSSITRYTEAYLRSTWFDPPPPETYNKSSEYYQTCKVRFAYHMYGDHIGPLKLYLIQNYTDAASLLFSETSENYDAWQTQVTSLPTVTQRYYLQFEGSRLRSFRGDAAIDDVSLSTQCFHIPKPILTSTTVSDTTTEEWLETTLSMTTVDVTEPYYPPSNETEFYFTSCGASGKYGPTQQQCNGYYRFEEIMVTVLKGDMAGVQVWEVPQTGPYSLTAKGSSGGTGVENTGPSYGAVVEATFNLTERERLYILVGQEGENACDSDGLLGNLCRGQLDDATRQQFGSDGNSAGGGGGGGGASFIVKEDPVTGLFIPLLVAAGGGGLSFSRVPPENQSLANGKVEGDPGSGMFGHHGDGLDVSGAGGGWNGSSILLATGHSFLAGGQGGAECYQAHHELEWDTRGGFGGGGGGCTTGGGGGGYTGGDAPMMKRLEGNGEGGTSLIHKSGIYVHTTAGVHVGAGQVAIISSVICPDGWNRSTDKQSCIYSAVTLPPPQMKSVKYGVIIGSLVPAIMIAILIVFMLLVYCRKSKQLKDAEKRMNTADFRLAELRNSADVDFNPCYSLNGEGAIKVSDLKELPRENLTLTSALGQGAFGEVYHGIYQEPGEKQELQVAVKTLPEAATENDEQEFLMEALIMGNFDHPNIVPLIGVSFCQHPRFILLEYMAGGELKMFLRESRPVDGQPSPLQMTDLLQIAVDVSKGCEYLEFRHFIHRDIAARNVLLTCKESGRVAKIGDFGMARDIYRSDYYKKGGQALLPVKWMPPEAFMDGVFTTKTDVWAFGVLLWEIMSLGFMPYPGMSNHEVIQFVTKGDRMNAPRYCPTPIQTLITRCWSHLPDDRPPSSDIRNTLNQCLQDPDIVRTPLPLRMTEMDQSRPSIQRPRNSKASPLLKVEDPSSSPLFNHGNKITGNTGSWEGRNGIEDELQKDDRDHCDVNANKRKLVESGPPSELRVRIPSTTSESPRYESTPSSPEQYANPSYSYNTPPPDAIPLKHPFSSSINDQDFASEKSDLIVRDNDHKDLDNLDRAAIGRSSSKQKSGSRKASLKALLRQTSKDSSVSGSRSNTPSPSPTSLTFSRQGSRDKPQQQHTRDASPTPSDSVDHTKLNGLPVANGKGGKVQNVPSPARVLRYNTTDGCILFEEEDDGQIV